MKNRLGRSTTWANVWVPLLVGGLALQAGAQSALRVRTSAQEDSEPKYVRHTTGAAGGFCVDLYRAMERADPGLEVTGDQVWKPLRRLEVELRNGQLDLLCGLLSTQERRTYMTPLQTVIYEVQLRLVVRADDEVVVRNWDDIRALGQDGVILTSRGSGYTQRATELGGLMVDANAASSDNNYRRLLAGRGRFYLYRSPGLMDDIREHGVEGRVKVLPVVLERQPFYLMVPLLMPEAQRQRLDAALARVKEDGTLARLQQRWLRE